jgi:hypothetical protein
MLALPSKGLVFAWGAVALVTLVTVGCSDRDTGTTLALPSCEAAPRCTAKDARTDASMPGTDASMPGTDASMPGTDGGAARDAGNRVTDGAPAIPDGGVSVGRACHAFTTEPMGCVMASPLRVTSRGDAYVLAPSTDGSLRALDPATGRTSWSVALPVPDGEVADITAPPAFFDAGHLVIGYQHVNAQASYGRITQNVAVLDLEARALDPAFPILTLDATGREADGGTPVPFSTPNTFGRSPLLHVGVADRTRGLVYVGFGNQRDIQPWHGWLFELDLDAWAANGPTAAVTGTLLTTPESDCGPAGASGARENVCGGGIWAPAGMGAHDAQDGIEIYVPTGNGQLDLARRDYANGLLRVERGLAFEPGCDATACTPWNAADPGAACLSTCRNLFVPRLLPGEDFVRPESGACDGMTLLECYATLDWDLGADTPARVSVPGGPDVIVLPAKDGAVYLFDAEHFGTLYDRETIAVPCGTATDVCTADWAGMMVTEPLVTTLDGMPLVMIPTFQFDKTHPAGVVALRIALKDGKPAFEPAWQAPRSDSAEAMARFRTHPGRLALTTIAGEPHAVMVDVGPTKNAKGTLLVIRVRDGEIVERAPLEGRGNRYVLPLVLEDGDRRRVVVSSCADNPPSKGTLEAVDLGTPCP